MYNRYIPQPDGSYRRRPADVPQSAPPPRPEPPRQEPDGLWILNPGSCGYGGGTAGLIQVENRKIVSCRILRDEDL